MDFREAKFQNFPGEHAPGPPSVPAPLALDPSLVGQLCTASAGPGIVCNLPFENFKTIIWIYPLLY